MKYQLSSLAEEDLIEIYLYGVYRFGENQAEKYFSSIQKEFERIAENPELFPEANHIKKGYRYCVHVSHTIYFKINDTKPLIIRIIGKQDFS